MTDGAAAETSYNSVRAFSRKLASLVRVLSPVRVGEFVDAVAFVADEIGGDEQLEALVNVLPSVVQVVSQPARIPRAVGFKRAKDCFVGLVQFVRHWC